MLDGDQEITDMAEQEAGSESAITPWDNAAETVKSLAGAVNTYDWKETQRICDDLVARLNVATTPFPERPAKEILNLLRRKRRFPQMEALGDAFIRSGQGAPQIQRQYAQAMIDQSNFTASRLVLKSILDDPSAPVAEKAEANGLLGRIYKQLYVNANDPSNPRQRANLKQGIQYYYDVYKTDPKSFLWHGINSVALLERARRDQVVMEGFPRAIDIAKQIEELLNQISDPAYWDRATAVENSVALGQKKEAYENAVYYVTDARVDAFECASLLRQLTEVWQLKDSEEPGSMLIPTLKACLLGKQGGQLDVPLQKVAADADGAQVTKERLEKVFGADRYLPLVWYRTGLKRCEAVARIESVTGRHVGTGFLVKASDFFPGRDANELFLLTNAHVISPPDAPFPDALAPNAATAVFEAADQKYTVAGVFWSSPPGKFDATFVTLTGLRPGSELCPLVPAADPFQPGKQQRVYVIGYPLGGGLSFSLQDSVWLDTDDSRLHYRTPTEPGSSGSPVFDEQYWTLLALHHAGGTVSRLHGLPGTYQANEGIAISAIQKATSTWVASRSAAGN
jgi:hypothetical protein